MGIVCYAFLANQKLTKNRPTDERRFQLKYGSKDGKLHDLWQDPFGLYTTLLVGVDPKNGIFVGADPVLHSPTLFFISIEFKEDHAEEIRRSGWHAWERAKRGNLPPKEDRPVEVLVGGTSATFLDYIRFERAAVGLDQGNRQLLAEKWSEFKTTPPPESEERQTGETPAAIHALAREFDMPERDILNLIGSARRLKMAVRGWVAEDKLVKALSEVPLVTECKRLDEEGGPDVSLRYDASGEISIQCKNVRRQPARDGTPKLDFQKTRASKKDPCSRYYRPDDFNLVAACLHAVTERWEFSYALPGQLDRHAECPGRLANNVRVDPQRWTVDASAALAAAAALV
jgi:hypothetical protein